MMHKDNSINNFIEKDDRFIIQTAFRIISLVEEMLKKNEIKYYDAMKNTAKKLLKSFIRQYKETHFYKLYKSEIWLIVKSRIKNFQEKYNLLKLI